jgi:hypothetical protein
MEHRPLVVRPQNPDPTKQGRVFHLSAPILGFSGQLYPQNFAGLFSAHT